MTGVPEAGGLDDPLLDLLDPRGEVDVSASVSGPQGTAAWILRSSEQNCNSWLKFGLVRAWLPRASRHSRTHHIAQFTCLMSYFDTMYTLIKLCDDICYYEQNVHFLAWQLGTPAFSQHMLPPFHCSLAARYLSRHFRRSLYHFRRLMNFVVLHLTFTHPGRLFKLVATVHLSSLSCLRCNFANCSGKMSFTNI